MKLIIRIILIGAGYFLGVGLLWMGYAWKIGVDTNSILSEAIAPLLIILSDPFQVILVTGLLGALIGTFSAMTGNSLRQIFVKERRDSLYH